MGGSFGYLQTLLNDSEGLDIGEEDITQIKDIKLPKTWKSLTITGVGVEKKTIIVLVSK
jgi:protein-glucosylgalactosylhydroxylysine glucosidase